jgi:hypothetical protein
LVLFFKKELLPFFLCLYGSTIRPADNARMAHIFLATPCYGAAVTLRYFHSVINTMVYGKSSGLAVTVETLAGDSLIPRARNSLVAKFLAHPHATHLLFVDADIGFEPVHLARLLALNEDIAACMYPLKQYFWDEAAVARARDGELITTAPLRYVGTPCPPEIRERRGDFVTADYAGTGFMLVARRAILRMIEAYPQLHFSTAHVPLTVAPELLYALFDTAIDPETRHYLSEDYNFCARWRAIGGKIWLDTQSALIHAGGHEFVGDPAARYPAMAEAVAA